MMILLRVPEQAEETNLSMMNIFDMMTTQLAATPNLKLLWPSEFCFFINSHKNIRKMFIKNAKTFMPDTAMLRYTF